MASLCDHDLVMQHPAHLGDDLQAQSRVQFGLSQFSDQFQQLRAFVWLQQSARAAGSRWGPLQPLLDPLHGCVVVLSHGLVVDAGVDHCRVQAPAGTG